MLNALKYYIKSDLQPFFIHEVKIYENATKYLPKGIINFSKDEIRKRKEKNNKIIKI